MDLAWNKAEYQDRAKLQSFECAPHPYRRAKKFAEAKRYRESIWASRVQSAVRDLEPRYVEPEYLELATHEGSDFTTLYYCKDLSWNDQTLRVLLGLVAVSSGYQGKQVGELAINRFFDQVGVRARAMGCTTIEIAAVAHESNTNCHSLLNRLGWTKVGRSEEAPDCEDWIIKGSVDRSVSAGTVEMPLPMVQSTHEEGYAALFPDGDPTLDTPLGVAYLWYQAIGDPIFYKRALRRLTYKLSAWGDLTKVGELVEGYGIAQNVHLNDEDPQIAYVRLIRVGAPGAYKMFSDAQTHDYIVLTVVQIPDGTWRVWGYSPNYTPTLQEVNDTAADPV